MGLYIPERWKTINLLAIDPGKHYIGISILELDARTGYCERIDIETIDVDRTFRDFDYDNEYLSNSDLCLTKIRRQIRSVLRRYDISYLGYESPFYNPRMPDAYGSLCEVVALIRHTVIDHDPYIRISCLSPQSVKKGMGAAGVKGKEIMLEKLKQNEELMTALVEPVDELTEHCVDSIAVGYAIRNTHLAPMEGWRI